MDWPVAAGDIFLAAALTTLVIAPFAGVGYSRRHQRSLAITSGIVLVATFCLLAVSWRRIPGGVAAAASAQAALLIAFVAMMQWGRVIGIAVGDPLLAGLAGLLLSVAITIGPFAMGPWMSDLPLNIVQGLLFMNPLVTVSTAAGIDFLHLDAIYRLSPLAHRGVALPAWTTACSGYAVLGLAGYGVSRLRPRSA